MVTIYENLVDLKTITAFKNFFYCNDDLVDDRGDVKSKIFPGKDLQFHTPQLQDLLHRVLPDPYEVEVVLFYQSRTSFRLHSDSGDIDGPDPYKVVLIPLDFEGPACTVFFDNFYSGPHARFSKKIISPFVYSLPDKNGNIRHIDDIRHLLAKCKAGDYVDYFDVNDEFILLLEHVVAARYGKYGRSPNHTITDYAVIKNYDSTKRFNEDTHRNFLSHVDIEDLHGLTIDKIVPWRVGDAVVFDRTQLHCAGSGHLIKTGITVLTWHKSPGV